MKNVPPGLIFCFGAARAADLAGCEEGEFPCLVCGGTVRFRRTAPGRTAGACSTAECIAWIETATGASHHAAPSKPDPGAEPYGAPHDQAQAR